MASLKLGIAVEKLRLAAPFRISGYVFEELDVVLVTLEDGSHRGRGEASGVYYLGDTALGNMVGSSLAMAPAFGPAFPASALKKISIPVEIVAGASDQNIPIASSAKYFAAEIPDARLHIFPGNVGHYVFLDSCTDAGRKNARLLCIDGKGVDRSMVHTDTAQMASEFFRSTLK